MRAVVGVIALGVFFVTSPAAAPAKGTHRVVSVSDTTTLLRALDRARNGEGPREIELRSGVYYLTAPIILDEHLSGTLAAPLVVYGASGAHAVLSGNRMLPNLGWHPRKRGIWRARLKNSKFQRLWFGDHLLVRARYPNYDSSVLPYGGVSADATAPARVARWRHPAGGIVHALHGGRWGGVHLEILGKNADSSLRFAPATGNNRNAPPSTDARFVENIFEELDAPGEWFYDQKASWLYYMPIDGRRPSAAGFLAGNLDEIIRITGHKSPAHDIVVRNITIRGTEPTFLKAVEPMLRSDWKFYRAGALTVENAERVQLRDLELTELGGNAVVVSGHAQQVAIERNHITAVGGSAIAFVGRPEAVRSPLFEYHETQPVSSIDKMPGPKAELYPRDSNASNNLIHDIGLIDKQAAGVEISMSARISIDHNSIYRVPRAGINIGDGTWGGHRITDNDVFDTVRETGDHGAFNSWGRDRYWDPNRDEMDRRVAADRSLVELDAREPTILRHNRFRCDHGWDIDLDDGSTNYIIEDNLLLAGGLKFREGFDRVARNNIMVNNTFHPHVWFKDGKDVFEHNIVMTAYQPIRAGSWGKSVDRNLFPTIADLKMAQTNGTDQHSLSGNPDFVDPTHGNYSVMPGSPALAIGFINFASGGFGVQSPRLRALAEQPVFPLPVVAPTAGEKEQPRSFAGMTIKSVETLGEQSAAGLATMEGVIIVAVAPGGAGANAGLRPGDVITAIGGTADAPGQTTPSSAALIAAAQGRKWQSVVEIIVLRNQRNERLQLNVQ